MSTLNALVAAGAAYVYSSKDFVSDATFALGPLEVSMSLGVAALVFAGVKVLSAVPEQLKLHRARVPFGAVAATAATVLVSQHFGATRLVAVLAGTPWAFSLHEALLRGAAVFSAAYAYRLAFAPRRQPVEGAIFVTGADSGMGEVSALHLAKLGFHVFAGCYDIKSGAKLLEQLQGTPGAANLTPVQLDVTKTESIVAAVATVRAALAAGHPQGLVGLIQCAGVGFTGPAEYFPMKFYRDQMNVNFFGYVEVCQAFLPLLRESVEGKPNARRARIVFTGTGGGVLTPAPALLSAYMASKWAGEAFMQSLRMEMRLQRLPIDACMCNPGFIKPTALMAGGKVLIDRMWAATANEGQARAEYEKWMDKFLAFSEAQPGTHPRYIAEAMEEAMTAPLPLTSYKVGPDSKASPFVGMLPTCVREWIVAKSMFNA